jgi:2-phosphosulfolactate phosphatase
MKIDVYFTVDEVDPPSLYEATVVVVDVVRATTTITEALANGARGIYPTASTEEAVRLATSLGREDALLCGERRGAKIEGFDLGNSPREFSREAVAGKRLVMSTTNGTRALRVGSEARRLFVCAFTNLGAVAAKVADAGALAVLCAGDEHRFSIDDALCVGHLVRRIVHARDDEPELDDGARATLELAKAVEPSREFLATARSGRALIDIGLGADLELCAEVDRHAVVPEMRDQAIGLAKA